MGEGYTGSAAVIQTQTGFKTIFQLKFTESTSVYSGELLAIDTTLDYILKNITKKSIHIFTDSLSNLLSISKDNTSPDTISIQAKIKEITNKGQVLKLHWVPGHKGIPGNEAADTAAKEATKISAPPQEQPHSLTQAKATIKKGMKQEWQRLWTNSTKGRHLFNEMPIIGSQDCWNLLASVSKRDGALISQLLSGHIPLNAHLHRINISESPLCPHCDTDETPHHFIFNCEGNPDLQTLIEEASTDPSDTNTITLLKLLQTEDTRNHILASLRARLKRQNSPAPEVTLPGNNTAHRDRTTQ